MEFSTLTRRVAEYSQIDPSDIEADASMKSASAPAHVAATSQATSPGSSDLDLFGQGAPGKTSNAGQWSGSQPKQSAITDTGPQTPKALADARRRGAQR
jgi:DNA polymerase-1